VGWKSPKFIVTLVFGLICLFGFAFWERIYNHPLLNPTVWRNRNFTACVLCVLFGYMSFITNQFWTSLYMQNIQKLGPLHIAVRMLPQALAGIFWSFVGQNLVSRLNGTLLMAMGSIAYLIGATLLFFIREHTSYWKLLFPALVITVLGADFHFIVANVSCLPLTSLPTEIKSLTPLAATRNETNAHPIFSGCWSASNSNASLGLHWPLCFHCGLRFCLVYAPRQDGYYVPFRARLLVLYYIRNRGVIMCSVHAHRDAGRKDITSTK
jgi:hypothetical protein